MNATFLTLIGVVLAAAALGWALRAMASRSEEVVGLPADAGASAEEVNDVEEIAEDGRDPIPLSSDGWAFMPAARSVHLLLSGVKRDTIVRGDLIDARVKRGAPDHDPWRLEALGRDGEYRAWRFETEDAARLALHIVRRVVQPRLDGEGDVLPVADADYAAALSREAEIEAELARSVGMPDDEESRRP